MSAKKWLYLFITSVITIFLSLEVFYRLVPFHRHNVDYLVKGKDLESISSTVYDTVNDIILRQGTIYLG